LVATDEFESPLAAQLRVFEETAARIRELNERLLEHALQAGARALDAYERALRALVVVAERVDGPTHLEWLSALAELQADIVRDLSVAHAAAVRLLLD
jgi:hypothetical protein